MVKYWALKLIDSVVLMFFTASIFVDGKIIAQEHPHEHPSEHPRGSKPKEETVTKEDLARAIHEYIEKDSKLKGGYFLIFDREKNKPLTLKLEKVHKDRLSKVADNIYFACVDLTTGQDKETPDTYDIDFFMKKTAEGFEVTEISIHKENGQPRYNWFEEKGIWKKKPAKQLYTCPMHPEFQTDEKDAKCPKCGMKVTPLK
ncbi:MAG: heavy metal-binding domain-containing protein [Planctomycetota bacterium]